MPRLVDGLTFEQWKKQVDAVLASKIGASSDDLPDFPAWDCWHEGLSPKDGALECLENDDLPWLDALEEDGIEW
jgi:hypothetical protein